MLPLLRHVYTQQVSWAIFTAEYLDSLHELLAHLARQSRIRVVEVCAGRGVLAAPMRARGIDWIATDASPPADAHSPVQQSGALDAVRAHSDVSVVFWAWWSSQRTSEANAEPEEQPEDRRLAEYCVSHGIPVVFISEPPGGITGSRALWDGSYRIQPAAERVANHSRERRSVFAPHAEERGEWGFTDLPQWRSVSDRTFVLTA